MPQHENHFPDFNDFIRAEYPGVIRFSIRRGASKELAEDIGQRIMLEMLRDGRWERFTDPEVRRAYMYRAARNALYEEWAKIKKRGEQELSPDTQCADPHQDTASLALANDESQVVLKILRSLPERQRTIMALTTDGYPPEDIAKILNLNPATVRSSLRHARNKLKAALQKRKDPAGEGGEREGLHR
jgi:RNA polymerase sigma-70 factor (ECF subfamily)